MVSENFKDLEVPSSGYFTFELPGRPSISSKVNSSAASILESTAWLICQSADVQELRSWAVALVPLWLRI